MPHKNIGILYSEKKKMGEEERILSHLAKKKKINLITINLSREMDEKEIEEKIKDCEIIFNNIGEGEFGIEIAKTVEALGKKIVESPETYYFIEDKWMFFLKCREHEVPVPETILLPENIPLAKSELKKFGKWPVILKRVHGTWGEYVDKAENLKEAGKIIKRFWEKGDEKFPILAQEFIHSPSYRVTVIGDKIVQTAIKVKKGWKSTGVDEQKFKKFDVDPHLEKIIKKVVKLSGIKICGIDLLKKDDSWFVIEINAQPGLDFFLDERERLLEEILGFLRHHEN